jgi:hypothetical protein
MRTAGQVPDQRGTPGTKTLAGDLAGNLALGHRMAIRTTPGMRLVLRH